MAKNKVSEPKQKPLNEDWVDQIPQEVQDAADKYDDAFRAQAKATRKRESTYDTVLSTMKETGCHKCLVRNGAKILRFKDDGKVVFENRKTNGSDDGKNGKTSAG